MLQRYGWPILLGAVLASCASSNRAGAPTDEAAPDNSAIVVRGSELSGNLLDALRYRVTSMRVSTGGAECPRIIFRGIRSVRNQANPTVYVDGARMGDTCILTQITSSDVDRVELYPSGNTTRTSYERNPFGLILVFSKRE